MVGGMERLRIAPKEEGNGRVFMAHLLGWATADGLWSAGGTTTRPVWMMVAGSDAEMRPFVANLQAGNKAELADNYGGARRGSQRFEILRKAGYATSWQRSSYGSVATLYLADLFRIDPGMVDPTGIRFVVLPERRWLSPARLVSEPAGFKKLQDSYAFTSDVTWADIVRTAPLFVAYLDRRTRCPILPDPEFHVRLFWAAIESKMAVLSSRNNRLDFQMELAVDVGLGTGFAFGAKHEDLEALLANETTLFLSKVAA